MDDMEMKWLGSGVAGARTGEIKTLDQTIWGSFLLVMHILFPDGAER